MQVISAAKRAIVITALFLKKFITVFIPLTPCNVICYYYQIPIYLSDKSTATIKIFGCERLLCVKGAVTLVTEGLSFSIRNFIEQNQINYVKIP